MSQKPSSPAPLRAAWCALAATLIALASPAVSAQDEQAEQSPPVCSQCGLARTIVFDTRRVVTAPARWQKQDRRRVGIETAIVVGSILALDKPVRDYVQDHKGRTTDNIANAFEPFGAEYALGTLAGFALIGKLAHKPGAQHVAYDGAVSGVIAGGLVAVLKNVTGRARPNTGLDERHFDPFGGDESFPSGHTAMAFALATSVAQNYDRPWIKRLSYGVAGLTAFARVEHDAHWLSDVTAGALIGVSVGKTVTSLHREKRRFALEPAPVADGWGLRVAAAF